MNSPLMSEDEELAAINELLESIEGLSSSDVASRVGNFRGILYGNDGVGKTIAGLALLNYIVEPEKQIILVDTAENVLSINNHPALKQARLSDGSPRIRWVPYRGETRILALAAACERRIPPFHNVGGVQLDELSTMADRLLAGILKIAEARDKSKAPDNAEWPDYKQLLRKMKNITDKFATIEGVHTVAIAHVRSDKGAFNKMVESPNFTPGVGREIRKPQHLIANVTISDEGDRRFRVQPTTEIVAKCKVGGLGPVVSFGTMATELKKWLGGEGTTVELQEVIATPVEATEDEEGVEIQ
jgi:hypothetical protein